MESHDTPLAAILAGGRSQRFGSPKALARVDGLPLLVRARDALLAVSPDPVLIGDGVWPEAAPAPRRRADAIPGLGPLGGIHTALLWAREEGRPGAVVAACDMPFLEPALFRRVLNAWRVAGAAADVVIPESDGPRGCEPLCGYYGVTCLPAIESALRRGERQMLGFHAGLEVLRIPLDEIRALGDPARLFFNINSPADHERAVRLAAAGKLNRGGAAG